MEEGELARERCRVSLHQRKLVVDKRSRDRGVYLCSVGRSVLFGMLNLSGSVFADVWETSVVLQVGLSLHAIEVYRPEPETKRHTHNEVPLLPGMNGID